MLQERTIALIRQAGGIPAPDPNSTAKPKPLLAPPEDAAVPRLSSARSVTISLDDEEENEAETETADDGKATVKMETEADTPAEAHAEATAAAAQPHQPQPAQPSKPRPSLAELTKGLAGDEGLGLRRRALGGLSESDINARRGGGQSSSSGAAASDKDKGKDTKKEERVGSLILV